MSCRMVGGTYANAKKTVVEGRLAYPPPLGHRRHKVVVHRRVPQGVRLHGELEIGDAIVVETGFQPGTSSSASRPAKETARGGHQSTLHRTASVKTTFGPCGGIAYRRRDAISQGF